MQCYDCLSLISKHRSAIMGVAIIWVIFRHLPIQIPISILSSLKFYGYGGVDVFLFLSGFGLFFSMEKNNSDLLQYYKKRFLRIIPEFWLFLVISFFIEMKFDVKSILLLLCYASTIGYWIPKIPYCLWFISAILFFYLVYPFYFRGFKKYGHIVPIMCICSGFSLVLIYALVSIFCFNERNAGGLLILSISRIPVFFLGAIFGYLACKKYEIKKSFLLVMIPLFVISCFILSSFVSSFKEEYLWFCGLYFIPFFIISPVICLFMGLFFEIMPKCLPLFLSKIGSISLELYVVHEFCIKKITNDFAGLDSSFRLIMIVFSSVFFALAIHFLNKKILTLFKNKKPDIKYTLN